MGQNTNNSIRIDTQLYPAYYSQFYCIADRCQDNCCHGWTIPFSKKDYLKIKRAEKPQELVDLTKLAMRRLPDGKRTEDRYAEFVTESGPCPYQNEQGLCRLQLGCGEETLPRVCREFPRTETITAMGLEKGLATSCEAVVELLWDLPQGVDFVMDPLEKQRQVMLQPNGRGGDFPVFRSAVIDILQARQFSLPRRLLILGLVLEKAAKAWETLDLEQWQRQVELLLADPALTEPLENLPGNRPAYLAQNMHTAAVIAAGEGSFLRQTLEDSGAFRNTGTEKAPHIQFEEQFYEDALARFEEAFGDREDFFENLMVNTAFITRVPVCTSPEALWQSYVTLCGTYSFFRFLTVLCCGMEPTREKLFRGVVLASRALLHNNQRQADLRDQFFKNDSATLAHMAVLVKG